MPWNFRILWDVKIINRVNLKNFFKILNFFRIIGLVNKNYEGYAIFLQSCDTDLSKIIGASLPIKNIFEFLS